MSCSRIKVKYSLGVGEGLTLSVTDWDEDAAFPVDYTLTSPKARITLSADEARWFVGAVKYLDEAYVRGRRAQDFSKMEDNS